MVNPLVIQVPGVTSDTSKPILRPDGLLKTDVNSGVRFLFDLGSTPGYSGGAPASGAVIKNLAGLGDGAYSDANANGVPSYAGGGFDYSSFVSADIPSVIKAPASVSADIWTAYSGHSQEFLVSGYVKLPTFANWNSSTSLATMFSLAAANTGYSGGPDLINVAMATTTPGSEAATAQLDARRQTAAATVEAQRKILPAGGDYGSVVQWAYWRNVAGQGFRLKSANGVILGTYAKGVDNTQDFSALQPCWGICRPFTALTGNAWPTGFRTFRGFIENLARSGRDPETVLNDDWTRTIARAVYS